MNPQAEAIIDAFAEAGFDVFMDKLRRDPEKRRELRVLLGLEAPARVQDDDGWLDTRGAAAYLCCSPGRIHDLVQLGKLTPRRDGRRLLFRRRDLDRYVEASA